MCLRRRFLSRKKKLVEWEVHLGDFGGTTRWVVTELCNKCSFFRGKKEEKRAKMADT